MLYQTDYRANYVPLSNKINPKEKQSELFIQVLSMKNVNNLNIKCNFTY